MMERQCLSINLINIKSTFPQQSDIQCSHPSKTLHYEIHLTTYLVGHNSWKHIKMKKAFGVEVIGLPWEFTGNK